MLEVPLQRQIADYLQDLAAWRRGRAEEYDRDARNIQSAEGLEALAAHVLTLPDDDERIQELGRIAVSGGRFEPGQQAHFAIARFRFHEPSVSTDGFLSRIVELQRADLAEMGNFGGRLPEGDNPWAPAHRHAQTDGL